ncbi:MAG: proteasome-type protease [Cyanobacteria bacterium]|nr:proteasome-type protease [Cyanobacteriota bacterium]MDW8200779.1 proteasome-type protease [Cyanobacteriota bacterium SKYGB_h_bin112]
MTYCLGIVTCYGLVMAADSRTNAGVDYISTYQKLFNFSQPGDRVILICTAGNLAITQSVLTALKRDLSLADTPNLHTMPTLYDAARYVGNKVREVQTYDREWLQKDGIDFQCSFLLGGQIQGQATELFLIYSQGNCIQATPETPFLQIGEAKYGKPILDRIVTCETSLEAATKAALLSIDSTMRSNASVGPPIHLMKYYVNSFVIDHQIQLNSGDPYLITMRKLWESSLRDAFDQIPDPSWH